MAYTGAGPSPSVVFPCGQSLGKMSRGRLDSSRAVVSPSVFSHLPRDHLLSLLKCRSPGPAETYFWDKPGNNKISACRNGVSHRHVAKHRWVKRILPFQGQAGLRRRMGQHVYCLLVLSLGARTRSPCPHLLAKRGLINLDFPQETEGSSSPSLPSAWGGPLGDTKGSSFNIRKSL